jgi:hypothetical protein
VVLVAGGVEPVTGAGEARDGGGVTEADNRPGGGERSLSRR